MNVGGQAKKTAPPSYQQYDDAEALEEVWREMFRMFDRDGNGHVSSVELGLLMRGLNLNPTRKQIDDFIRQTDTNGTGQIELDEFLAYMRHQSRQPGWNCSEDILRAFKLFDHNDDDHIDAEELRRVVTSTGECLTKEEADLMIRLADVDMDGRINYKEFVKFILSPCL